MKKKEQGSISISHKNIIIILVVILLFKLLVPSEPAPVVSIIGEGDNYEIIEVMNTGSMRPLIKGDSALGIAVKDFTKEDIKVGNIVVYRPIYADRFRAHRIVFTEGDIYYVKGDSSDDFDFIEFEDIEYKIVAIIN